MLSPFNQEVKLSFNGHMAKYIKPLDGLSIHKICDQSTLGNECFKVWNMYVYTRTDGSLHIYFILRILLKET